VIRTLTLEAVLTLGAVIFAPVIVADGIIDEVIIGVFEHDAELIAPNHEGGIGYNGEIRFFTPGFMKIIGEPRPTLGVTYATDQPGTDQVYGGLTWTIDLSSGFYTDIFFGLSKNNGNDDRIGVHSNGTSTGQPSAEKHLGCSELFRESIELGYRLGDRKEQAVSIMVSHSSTGEILCNDRHNPGMDHWGLRYGYKF
jgi:lipid A 3-O-deacylase